MSSTDALFLEEGWGQGACSMAEASISSTASEFGSWQDDGQDVEGKGEGQRPSEEEAELAFEWPRWILTQLDKCSFLITWLRATSWGAFERLLDRSVVGKG